MWYRMGTLFLVLLCSFEEVMFKTKMTMKKHLLIGILFLFNTTIGAQSDADSIRETIENYMAVAKAKDYVKTMDYLYPKLFDLVPRSVLEESLKNQAQDTTIQIEFENNTIEKISKVLLLKGIKYALVDYSFLMKMTIKGKDEEGLKMMQILFEGSYGKKNVSLDTENSTFSIQVNRATYLINNPEYEGWKLLERKEGLLSLLEKILPKKVLKKLK